MFGGRHPILSRPMDVHWTGWKSNTYSLQQAGWELSADQDIRSMAMRLVFRNKNMRCVAVSQLLDGFRFEDYALNHSDRPLPSISIQYFACHIEVLRMQQMECMNFKPIDAAPQFLAETTVKSYEDLNWFATPLVRTEEIIVEPAKIADLLEQIKKIQLPEQEAIRARAYLREKREGMDPASIPRQRFHAQVLSIAA